jgi:1-acyl-sn-glycerol-3-phosphate acyltransferase
VNSTLTTYGEASGKTERQPFLARLARLILRRKGWKIEVALPDSPKYVLIGAPHTTNLDAIYALLLRFAANIPMRFIAKDSLFRPPFGFIIRWFGGIPVDRSSSNNFVEQIVSLFNNSPALVIAIAPEGTRSLVPYWRTGFYYMAQQANVPIAFGYVDYDRKTLGIHPGIEPSGDLPADMERIRHFYNETVCFYQTGRREIILKDQETAN